MLFTRQGILKSTSAGETKLKGADLTWSNLANNYEEREKQKE